MNNVLIKKEENEIILDIASLNQYDDFESLIKYLEKYFNAHIIEKLEGPDIRICKLEINRIPFKLQYDFSGNSLFSNITGEDIICEIYLDLRKRLE